MWTGVIVLVVVLICLVLAGWLVGLRPTRSRHSRGDLGIQPGRDYGAN